MKKVFFVCLIIVASLSKAVASAEDSTSVLTYEEKQDSLISSAIRYIGIHYCRGGKSKNCFDCSGFVSTVFAKLGYALPRTSGEQARTGKAVKSKKDIRKGDIIYFKGRNKKSKRVGHVGIVVQNDGHSIMFIHASSTGIKLEELEISSYYLDRYLGARRVLN